MERWREGRGIEMERWRQERGERKRDGEMERGEMEIGENGSDRERGTEGRKKEI
jgi:hypothetical protein